VTLEKVTPNKLKHDSAFDDPGHMTPLWQMISLICQRPIRGLIYIRKWLIYPTTSADLVDLRQKMVADLSPIPSTAADLLPSSY